MSEAVEKFDLKSHSIAEDKKQELLRLFPEIRTEGGKIDFDRLKLALGETVDVGKERYGMNWPGKADCFKTLQAPSLGTLRPCPEESVNFDTTENLIIEGDNLEVLKLLQKSYLGKVKMIYIDPPYNTGNDFVYPDNYSESLQTYLEYTGQVDAEGKKFGTNTDTDGRFHSNWMNMMYPRLFLARNLLREDGVIVISIDDNEVDNCKKICNEIFGEENFFASLVWQKKDTTANDSQGFSVSHEYVIIYTKLNDRFQRYLIPRTEEQIDVYKNPDNDPRGVWTRGSLIRREGDYTYSVTRPDGTKINPPVGSSWRVPTKTYLALEAENRIWWGKGGQGELPFKKIFLAEAGDGVVPTTWWNYEFAGSTRTGKNDLKAIFGDSVPFDTPKPVRLLLRILGIAVGKDDIILDFFAGSGTTAQAILELNGQDSGNRKFILIQIPEPADRKKFSTIADICKERIRRVAGKLLKANEGKLDLLGIDKKSMGFRVFKLSESNFKYWNSNANYDGGKFNRQLELHVDHILPDRSQLDLLYELLLKSGFPLTAPVEKISLAGKDVFSVQGGALFICLVRELTLDLIRAMAEKKPERVVCLDEGFAGNDQLKANAVQIFKTKGVARFQTV